MSTFKIDITKGPLFFLISYLLLPKIEVCIKYFLNKIPQGSHSARGMVWQCLVCLSIPSRLGGWLYQCVLLEEGRKEGPYLPLPVQSLEYITLVVKIHVWSGSRRQNKTQEVAVIHYLHHHTIYTNISNNLGFHF